MTNSEIRTLLTKLRSELQDAQLDDQTHRLMRDLDSDIHDLLGAEKADIETATIVNRAREIEADFESDYPTAVSILREIVAALSRMGI